MLRELANAKRLAKKGELDRAIKELDALRTLAPDDERLCEELAELRLARARRDRTGGRLDAAIEDYRGATVLLAEVGRLRAAARATRERLAIDPRAGAELANLQRRRLRANARDFGLALLTALIVLGATPPWDAWPLALVALVPLLLAIRNAGPGRAFLLGWIAGLVANAGGNFWGVELMERFAKTSTVAGFGIVIVVSAYQALVFALWAAMVAWLRRRARLPALLTAPLAIAVLEAAIPFVFPWYLAITVWRAWSLCQVAELGGPPAVSALVVLLNVLVLEVGTSLARKRHLERSSRIAAAVALAILVLGLVRAAHVAHLRGEAKPVRVGIVQPNFGILSMELRKHQGQRYADILRRATEEAGARGADLVVWPESMFPFLFDRGMDREYAKGHPWALRGSYQGALLAGVLSHPFGESYIYNSAILVAPDGSLAGTYDKTALLVMGEYVPMRDRFPAWAKRVRASLPDWPEIEPGTGPKVLVAGDLRVLPLICYEDILPSFVARGARTADPNLLVTIANHAWFGDGAAPHQAEALATFRSIETRRDLVRATNTGVSSMTDALGRLVVEGPLYDVPRDQPRSPDVFVEEVRLVDTFALGPYAMPVFPYACAAALLGIIWWRRRRR